MRSRKRCRLPGVPENWNVACTAYGSRPARSAMRCAKNVCPPANSATGRMPMRRLPSYTLRRAHPQFIHPRAPGVAPMQTPAARAAHAGRCAAGQTAGLAMPAAQLHLDMHQPDEASRGQVRMLHDSASSRVTASGLQVHTLLSTAACKHRMRCGCALSCRQAALQAALYASSRALVPRKPYPACEMAREGRAPEQAVRARVVRLDDAAEDVVERILVPDRLIGVQHAVPLLRGAGAVASAGACFGK